MRILRNSMLAVAVAAMTACSSDEPVVDNGQNGQETGEAVYMALTVEMPGADGSRSATSDNEGGTGMEEVGQGFENTVQSVAIVLCDNNNNFITWGEVESGKLQAISSSNSYKTVAKFSKTALSAYYTEGAAAEEKSVNVFVFCNPTADLKSALSSPTLNKSQWYEQVCNVTVGTSGVNTGIWSNNSFLMNNKYIATRSLPMTIEDWNNYKTEATAFDLSGWNAQGQANQVNNSESASRGAIKVQRSVARFDFKDGSANGNNTYDVVFSRDDEGNEGPCFVQVQLNRMALVNMVNKFYYVPRVSADGQNTGSILCGGETASNYVVGPYAVEFQTPTTSNFTQYFNYPFFNENGTVDNNNVQNRRWDDYMISDVLGGNVDNYKGEYKIWRYVTENVIPGPAEDQVYSNSTGVVFKGKMKATDAMLAADPTQYLRVQEMARYMNNVENCLTGNPSKDPIIFLYAGQLYFTWSGVREAVINQSLTINKLTGKVENINRSNSLYIACFGNGGMGTISYKLGDKTYTYTDELAEDTNSANHAYQAWATAGQPEDDTLLPAMRAAATGANFTLYQSSNDLVSGPGYYTYYYYWNRHNDNGNSGLMGPMEFGVVRNNVYKLAVTKISRLGHPRISANDPDDPKPDTPDESDDIYLSVTCQVLPWVVRLNNIEF